MTDLVAQLVGALEGMADLYDTDEGCKSLPQYIAARAALSAAKDGGWLPIEAAPNGASALIHRRGDLYPGVAYLSGGRWYWSSNGGWAGHPTHYQPLPNPPKGEV